MPKALALIAHNLEGIYSVVFDKMAIKLTIYGLDWPKLLAKMSRILQLKKRGVT